MTSWKMPMTSLETFIVFLEAGWTCFQHGPRYWITVRPPDSNQRLMIPVPTWIVDSAIAQTRAVQAGIRILPTFTIFARRSA